MIILKRNFASRGVVIDPWIEAPNEFIAYDLHVGDSYQLPGDSNRYTFPEQYVLKPGHCILVGTAERLSLPSDVFAVLCSKGSLTARGLMVPNTKIDPLFSDHLQISIFNASAKPIEVKRGMGFCAAYFQTAEYDIPWSASRGALAINIQRRNKFVEFLQVNTANIVTVLIAILGAAAATLATLYFNETQKSKASAQPQEVQQKR